MTTITFNPLAVARDLKDAGIEAEHAEAIAGAVHQAAGADRADLATKADIDALKGDIDALKGDIGALKGDIGALRKETKADIHREIGTLRSELRWILGFLGALILAMAANMLGIA